MNSQERFEELKRKYAPVIRFLDESRVRLQEMNIENDKLVIRAAVGSEVLRDEVLGQIARIDNSFNDLTPDIRIEGRPNMPMTGQTTVNTSESFSRQGELPPKGKEQPR